jgi:hypothetical protein
MTVEELKKGLSGAKIFDLFFGGFIDSGESPPRFRALRTSVYLEFGGRLVRFHADDSTGTMIVSFVDEVRCDELDDDMTLAVCSVREDVLDDAIGANPIAVLRFWGVTDEPSGVRCFAAEIETSNGQTIFLDPSYHFGIRVGSRLVKSLWIENWPGALQHAVQEIRLCV